MKSLVFIKVRLGSAGGPEALLNLERVGVITCSLTGLTILYFLDTNGEEHSAYTDVSFAELVAKLECAESVSIIDPSIP